MDTNLLLEISSRNKDFSFFLLDQLALIPHHAHVSCQHDVNNGTRIVQQIRLALNSYIITFQRRERLLALIPHHVHVSCQHDVNNGTGIVR